MEFQELVETLSTQSRYTRREIRQIVLLLIEIIRDNLAHGRDTQLRKLGKFRNVPAGVKCVRNKYTGERRLLPPSRRVKFEPTQELKELVRSSESLFKQESLESRFGLPKKEDKHGKVRRRDRPRQGPKRKEGRSRG